MLVLVQANGKELRIDMSISDFTELIAAASPSPWVTITLDSFGVTCINVFTMAYYYEE